MSVIPAAGTLPWRVRDGALEVALVHRPRYDDWSWAKGKLDPGEEWPVAAVRETEEETGLLAALGVPLPEVRYTVLGRGGAPEDKVVRYWAARVVGGKGTLENEIDEVAWLSAKEAYDRLDYSRDRALLLGLVREHGGGRLETWPFVVVRHAKAISRHAWDGTNDRLRPLDARGRGRAGAIVPILAAYDIQRVVTSSSTRCVQTVAPYAATQGLRLDKRDDLSEEGFEEAPAGAPRRMERLLRKGVPVAVCGHGPVLPAMLDVLRSRISAQVPDVEAVRALFAAAMDDRLVKGEVFVCHVVGVGEDARVVAVERHLP